jgi:5'-3' exonuclease
MGVHYFFPWIKKECPQCVGGAPVFAQDCVLLFDVNGLLYGARKTPKEACEDVMKIVKSRIAESRASVVVLALDGVAPKAKRWQQRKRRFLNPTNNNLSVGSDFMTKLDSAFVSFLDENVLCPSVFYSGTNVAGEGEHKLFKFLKQFQWKNHKYIFGVDGDLLVLSLLSLEKDLFVIRPVFMRPGSVECVSIDIFREYISLRFADVPSFVCLASVLGNDFLPSVEPHDTRDSFELFLKTVESVKCVDSDGTIDWSLIPDRESPSERGKSFARGVQWILNYYTQKEGSEQADWFYPHNERPRWQEIGTTEPIVFSKVDPVERLPLFQLFFLMPLASIDLLPVPLRLVYAESFSVQTVKRKKRPSWDVDHILEVDTSIDLVRLYKLVEHALADDEKNARGQVFHFSASRR